MWTCQAKKTEKDALVAKPALVKQVIQKPLALPASVHYSCENIHTHNVCITASSKEER